MISLPAMLVLEAKNGETGQQPNVDILEESSTVPAIPGEFLNLSEGSSNYAGKTCAMSAGLGGRKW